MKVDDIPSTRYRPPSASRIHRQPIAAPWTRRRFVKSVILTASAFSLTTLGRLPVARGSHDNRYEIDPLTHSGTHPSNCLDTPAGGWYKTNATCDVCGPATSYSDVCVQSSHFVGYHKNSGCVYQLRPNVCSHAVGSVDYDGWLWTWGSQCCFVCQGSNCTGTYKNGQVRCHDGKKCNASCVNCSNSICEWRTSGTQSGCPN